MVIILSRMKHSLPEYSFESTSPAAFSDLQQGGLTVNGCRMTLTASVKRIILEKPALYPDCEKITLWIPRMDNEKFQRPAISYSPIVGRSYLITQRTSEEYFEIFPQLAQILKTRKHIWELGPGLSDCLDTSKHRDSSCVFFDSAPYDLLYAISDCVLQNPSLLDVVVQGERNGQRVEHALSLWRDRSAERLTDVSATLIQGAFPQSLDQAVGLPDPDLIVEHNGPGVCFFDESTVKKQLGSEKLKDARALLRLREIREYVQRLVLRLAPNGYVLFRLSRKNGRFIHLEMQKEEAMEILSSIA